MRVPIALLLQTFTMPGLKTDPPGHSRPPRHVLSKVLQGKNILSVKRPNSRIENYTSADPKYSLSGPTGGTMTPNQYVQRRRVENTHSKTIDRRKGPPNNYYCLNLCPSIVGTIFLRKYRYRQLSSAYRIVLDRIGQS